MTFDEAAAKGLIQPPQGVSATAETAASVAEQPAATDAGARTEVKPPETRADETAAVMPPENPKPSIPAAPVPRPVTEGLQPSSGASLIILPAVLKKAEENLATYFATRMDTALTEGLRLTLSSAPVKGMTDVKLCLDGPMVAANASLVGQQALAALRDIPAVAPYFNNASKPHAQKPDGAVNANMVHIHIPQLTTAQYAMLIQSLAAGIATGQSSTVRRDAQADVAEAVLPVAPVTASVAVSPDAVVAEAKPELLARTAPAVATPSVSQDAAVAEATPEALKEVALPVQQIVQSQTSIAVPAVQLGKAAANDQTHAISA